MTGLGPSPLRLGVFAGDNPISAFAPFAVDDPGPNPLWLQLRCAGSFVVETVFASLVAALPRAIHNPQ